MLSTLDIRRLMNRNREFVGVFPIDRLPINLLNKPSSLIVNLDEAYKSGSHWVAIYFPKVGYAVYMDPLGSEPPPLIASFLQRNSKHGWKYNKTKLQGDMSLLCGYYCVVFLRSTPKIHLFFKKFKNCNPYNEVLIKRLL